MGELFENTAIARLTSVQFSVRLSLYLTAESSHSVSRLMSAAAALSPPIKSISGAGSGRFIEILDWIVQDSEKVTNQPLGSSEKLSESFKVAKP
jgi:hypothetical protein